MQATGDSLDLMKFARLFWSRPCSRSAPHLLRKRVLIPFCPQFRTLIPKSRSTCPAAQCYARFNGGKKGWSPTPRTLRAPSRPSRSKAISYQRAGKRPPPSGPYPASSSLSLSSRNFTSSGLTPGPPAKCPQMDGMGISSAFGMLVTSISLSATGKYRSVWPGMT